MNLTVKIYEFIQNSRLFEMARSLAEVKQVVYSTNNQIRMHLLCLYLWGNNSQTKNHWISETVGFLPDISKVKGRSTNKGFLTQKEILDQSWNSFEDVIVEHFSSLIKLAEMKENLKAPKNRDAKKYYSMVKEYYYEMSNQLSSGIVDIDLLSKILSELVRKYGVK